MTEQAKIDAARMEAAKQIIGSLGAETDFRFVAENWCASAMQELANAQYFKIGRDEVIEALRRVLESNYDDKFEMQQARKDAWAVVNKHSPEEHWIAVYECPEGKATTEIWGSGKTGIEAYTNAVRILTESGMEIPTLKVKLTIKAEWIEIP